MKPYGISRIRAKPVIVAAIAVFFASLISSIVSLLALPFAGAVHFPSDLSQTFCVFAIVFCSMSFLWSISGIVILKRYHSRSKITSILGKLSLGLAILVSVVAIYLWMWISRRSIAVWNPAISNMNWVARAMLLYANDHEDKLPDPNRWCDILIDQGNVGNENLCIPSFGIRWPYGSRWPFGLGNWPPKEGPMQSIRPGSVIVFPRPRARTCDFAMNRNCRRFPGHGDPILLFSSKSGWNQSGDPEMAEPVYAGDDHVLVYRDSSGSTSVHKKDIPELLTEIGTIPIRSLVEKLVDITVAHIKSVGPDEDAAQFIAAERFTSWERREEIATATIPYLRSKIPSRVAGALAVLYRLRSYRPLHDIGPGDGSPTAWEQKYKPGPFWAKLDRQVIASLEHVHSLGDSKVFHNLALYLGVSQSPESKRELLRIASETSEKEQALICLAWHRDEKDMESLFPFMLGESHAAWNLPHHFRDSYGTAAIPYLKRALEEAESAVIRQRVAYELVHLRVPEGFRYLRQVALADPEPEERTQLRPLEDIRQFAADYLSLPEDTREPATIAAHIAKKERELCRSEDSGEEMSGNETGSGTFSAGTCFVQFFLAQRKREIGRRRTDDRRWRTGYGARRRPRRSDQGLKVQREGGDIFGNDLPDDLEVDVEVAVDETIPRGRDLAPGNLRVPVFEFVGKTVGGFAYNFQQANDSQLQFLIGLEVGRRESVGEREDLLGGVSHVTQAKLILLSVHRRRPPPS